MSTRFTIYCNTCDEAGPHIRRQHDKAILMEEQSARFFPDSDNDQAMRDWGGFLIEHEYHELSMRTEYRPPKPSEPEVNRNTHMLMEDGSLKPL